MSSRFESSLVVRAMVRLDQVGSHGRTRNVLSKSGTRAQVNAGGFVVAVPSRVYKAHDSIIMLRIEGERNATVGCLLTFDDTVG